MQVGNIIETAKWTVIAQDGNRYDFTSSAKVLEVSEIKEWMFGKCIDLKLQAMDDSNEHHAGEIYTARKYLEANDLFWIAA